MCRFRVSPAQFGPKVCAAFHLSSFRNLMLRASVHVQQFARDERAATAVEYGLIVAGISIAILSTVFAIGEQLNDMFTFISTKLLQNVGS